MSISPRAGHLPLSEPELPLDEFWARLAPYEITRAWTQPRSGARCSVVDSSFLDGDIFVKQTDDPGTRPAWPEVHFATLLQMTRATRDAVPVVPPPVAWGNGPTYLAYHFLDGDLVHNLLRDHRYLDADDRDLIRECARTIARLHGIDASEVRTFGVVPTIAGSDDKGMVLSAKDLGPWNCVASDAGPVVLIDTPVFQLAPPAHDVGRMTIRLARATVGTAGGFIAGLRTAADVVQIFGTTYRDSLPAGIRPSSDAAVLWVSLRQLAIATLRDMRQGRWMTIRSAAGMALGAMWGAASVRVRRTQRAVG